MSGYGFNFRQEGRRLVTGVRRDWQELSERPRQSQKPPYQRVEPVKTPLQTTLAWFGIGQDSLVDKALGYRPKGTGFNPRLDHKRRSTWATNSFSMWDNKDLLIVDHWSSRQILFITYCIAFFFVPKTTREFLRLIVHSCQWACCLSTKSSSPWHALI
jgi:hypothetical protein